DVMPITEGDRTWDELRQRAIRLRLRDDLSVNVVGKDDLIAMKRASGRRQDIEDIAQITVGAHLARNARARVLLTGRVLERASDEQALEAADIATLPYEHDVRFRVDRDEREDGRRLVVTAELPGFAREHAELWASIVARKIGGQEVLDGEMDAEISARADQ
ncbi:MAG: hypothetical protein ACRDL4_11875, partial [Thermoleophilaceae bacterium]